VRELERRPLRALWSILGLGLAMSMLIVGSFSRDTMDQLADIQFGRAFTADLSVGLIAPAPMDALASLRQLPGVEVVEPMRAAAVRIRAGHHVRELALTALPAHSSLRQILDRDGDPIELPPDGLMLGVVVAERLGVGVGDAVEITPYEGDRLPRQVTVTALSDEMIGRTAYMELHAWARVLGQAPSLSGASLTVDPDHMAQVLSRLATMPGVAAVSEKRTITEAFERTTASFTTQMTLVVVLFASIIAVGVIYNNGRIALGERARELATLRVLGFTGREVAGSLVGEMVVHLVISVPVGMWLGREFARLLMAAADPERYRMVAYVAPRTFALAALVVGAAAAVTAAVMARRVHHLDPVSALKAND
jgi:putative ABC transport system permease protein